MRDIVRDEQRSNRPKSARPTGVAPGSPPDGGASLERATSPSCETLLAGELPGAITVGQCHGIMLYRAARPAASPFRAVVAPLWSSAWPPSPMIAKPAQ